MRKVCKSLFVLAFAVGSGHVSSQNFYYVEAGIAACPAAPERATGALKAVSRGVPMSGSISVTCGFNEGSYTVTLHSSDPGAEFSPKTFLVNFGRIVGKGVFAVTFSTAGVQRLSATITSNMGSPAVRGHFAARADQFNVLNP